MPNVIVWDTGATVELGTSVRVATTCSIKGVPRTCTHQYQARCACQQRQLVPEKGGLEVMRMQAVHATLFLAMLGVCLGGGACTLMLAVPTASGTIQLVGVMPLKQSWALNTRTTASLLPVVV